MKAGFAAAVIATAGVSVLLAAGCSKGFDRPTASSSSSTTAATTTTAVTAAPNLPPGQAQVVIGGGDTGPAGMVDCADAGDTTTITIGEGSAGVTLVLTDEVTPTLKSLGIGDLGGVSLGYFDGGNDQVPTITRDGSSYRVTGAGSGTDTSDPSNIVDTTYDISVTCP